MDFSSVGKNIRFYRMRKHLTQEDLAEMTGYTPNYIGMIERGERVLPLNTFITLVNVLDVSADMVLADLLTNSYKIRESRCLDRLASMFPMTEKATVETLEALVAAYETFIEYSKTKNDD